MIFWITFICSILITSNCIINISHLKNDFLRFLIKNDYKKIKFFKNKLETKVQSKLYDIILLLNELDEEQLKILEEILNNVIY